MAPHLIQVDLDWREQQHKAGKPPLKKIAEAHVASVRKALKARTYKRSVCRDTWQAAVVAAPHGLELEPCPENVCF